MMVFYFFLFSQRPPLCLCNVLLSLIVNIGNQQTGPQPNLIHCGFYFILFFLVNEVVFLSYNTAIPKHFHAVYNCFHNTVAEISSCERDQMYLLSGPFQEMFADS